MKRFHSRRKEVPVFAVLPLDWFLELQRIISPWWPGFIGDNSGQGSPTESRLHQSLAIRVSHPRKFKASAGDGAEDVLGLGAATPSILMASLMETKLTRIQGWPV